MSELIAPEQAARLESLGDNCEIGFVFDRIGHKSGGLFRWTAMGTKSLLALLQGRLENLYDYENIRPTSDDMVGESRYNIFWHSEMFSHIVDGQRVYRMPEEERRAIYEREVVKRAALVEKFHERLKAGNTIFVLKANSGIEPALIDAIEAELTAMAGGARFEILYLRKTSEGEKPGTLIKTSPRRWEGLVSFFAPYDKADQYDFDSWQSILVKLLG